MARKTANQETQSFRGLNNVVDPRRLDLSWLVQADNVDVTNRSALVRCSGFTKRTTNFAITGAYATKDLKRLYVVDAGELRQMNADLTYTVLESGLSSGEMYFEEVNGLVYYANGVDFGVIEATTVRQWGIEPPAPPAAAVGGGVLQAGRYQIVCTLVDARGLESGSSAVTVVDVPDDSSIVLSSIPQESGYTTNVYVTTQNGTVFMLLRENAASSFIYNCGPNQLGRELPFWNADAPRGSMPAHFAGRMHLAETFAAHDMTVIWRSQPLHFHHFDLSGDALSVPGTVRMLKALRDVLLIGTDRQIFGWDGERLVQLANYGVVPGWHASELEGQMYFWSLRGLCRAMPFENLTQSTVSVPPGSSAGAMVIEKDGMRRYVVALQQGGEAYNSREEA